MKTDMLDYTGNTWLLETALVQMPLLCHWLYGTVLNEASCTKRSRVV